MANPMIPLRLATFIRQAHLQDVAFVANSKLQSIRLDSVGLLGEIIVTFRGTIVTGASPAYADDGIWNLVNKFLFKLNNGSANIVDMSGYEAMVFAQVRDRFIAPNVAGVGVTTPDSNYYTAPLAASSTNNVLIMWSLPVSINVDQNFDSGILPMNSRDFVGNLEITTNPTSSVVTAGLTSIAGTFEVSYLFHEGVDFTKVAPPEGYVVRTYSQIDNINSDNTELSIQVNREGVITDLVHILYINGQRADAFTQATLDYNNNSVRNEHRKNEIKYLNKRLSGVDMPRGVFYHLLNTNLTERIKANAVDTTQISQVEAKLQISAAAGGTSFGANNNYVKTLVRVVQPIVFAA